MNTLDWHFSPPRPPPRPPRPSGAPQRLQPPQGGCRLVYCIASYMLSSIMYYYDKKLNSKFTTYVRDLGIITALVVFDRYLKYTTRMLRVVLRNTDGTVARQFPHRALQSPQQQVQHTVEAAAAEQQQQQQQ